MAGGIPCAHLSSMRFTIEEHGERLKRFAHLKPARGLGARRCGAVFPGSVRACTRPLEHRGPHVCHGTFGKLLAAWEDETGSGPEPSKAARENRLASARNRAVERRAQTRRVSGAPDSTGPLAALGRRALKLLSSPEELALLVLFLGLLVWGLDVARRILVGW